MIKNSNARTGWLSKDDELVIIDYKTGEKDKKHEDQISKYAMYFNELGYKNVKKLLVYINEDIEIVSIY